jgi:hypothetical protein
MMMCCLIHRSLMTGDNCGMMEEVNNYAEVCFRIIDMQKVLDGEIEIEAIDSHNNWWNHSRYAPIMRTLLLTCCSGGRQPPGARNLTRP